MKTTVILVVLLPLCSAAPLVKDHSDNVEGVHVDHSDNVEGVHVQDSEDKLQNPRQGRSIQYGKFKMGHISLSSDSVVEGDHVVIGHKLNINVHRHFDRHAGHGEAGQHGHGIADHHGHDVAGQHGHDVTGHHGQDGELRERLRLLFKSIDENQDGIIDVKELVVVCQENNIQITEAEANTILTHSDKTAGVTMAVFLELLEYSPSSNTADMVQFLLLATAASLDHGEFEKNLKYVFLALDTDHDCKVFITDLQTVFSDMGSYIPLNDAKSLLSGEHHIHTIGNGLDFNVWKKMVLKEVFKTQHLIHYWREAFAEIKKSFYEVGDVTSTSILNVAKTAATFLDRQLSECSHVKVVRVENAVVELVEGLEFTLELRLAALVGENCQDSAVMVCENIAVLKPLPPNCTGIVSLKLINRERITCTNICPVDQVSSGDCLCDSGTSGLIQACSSNQGCSNYGICLDVCTADQTNSAPCFCKSRSSDSGVACSSSKGCAQDASCPGGISQQDILNERLNRIDQNLKTIEQLTVAIQNIVDRMKVLASARNKRSDDELSSDESKLLELVDQVTNLVKKCGNCHICETNKIKDMTQKIISAFNKMEETIGSMFQNSFDEEKAELKMAISATIKCLEEEKAKVLTALSVVQTAAATTVVSTTTTASTTMAANKIRSTATTISDTAAAATTKAATTTMATTLADNIPVAAATTKAATTTTATMKTATTVATTMASTTLRSTATTIADTTEAAAATIKAATTTTATMKTVTMAVTIMASTTTNALLGKSLLDEINSSLETVQNLEDPRMVASATEAPTLAITITAATSKGAATTMAATTKMSSTTTAATTMAATNFYNWVLSCINSLEQLINSLT